MSRWEFIKIEWLRVSVMLLLTASLPFMYGVENPAGMDPFAMFAFVCVLFWGPFVGFMLSENMRKALIYQRTGESK